MNAHRGSRAGTRRDALREWDSEREDAVIARLSTLAPALDGEPDPAFRAAARTRLVAMAAVRTPGAPAVEARPAGRRRVWRRLTASLATAAVVAAALTALIAIAAGSGPGDPLYGVKRGTEQAELALASDSGPVLLHQAGTRLAEVRELAGKPTPDPKLIVQTLHTMDAQTTDAAAWFDARAVDSRSAAPAATFSQWASGQSRTLAALRGQLPASVSTAVQHSLDLLAAARSRADAVAKTLSASPKTPATGTVGRNGSTHQSPGAPTSTVGGPGVGTVPGAPGRGGATSPAPGIAPALPTPGGGGGIGGLPTLPVPHASAPGGTLPLPTLPLPTLPLPTLPLPSLPLPSGTAICVVPLGVGGC